MPTAGCQVVEILPTVGMYGESWSGGFQRKFCCSKSGGPRTRECVRLHHSNAGQTSLLSPSQLCSHSTSHSKSLSCSFSAHSPTLLLLADDTLYCAGLKVPAAALRCRHPTQVVLVELLAGLGRSPLFSLALPPPLSYSLEFTLDSLCIDSCAPETRYTRL
jgi:hypothetical protein